MTLYRVHCKSKAAVRSESPIAPALALQHPNEVLQHPTLTDAEKRAILASWASDAHAVEDAPWLRQVESGARVPVSEVLGALRSLDDRAADAASPQTSANRRARRIAARQCAPGASDYPKVQG